MKTPDPKTRRFMKTRQEIITAACEIIRTEGVDALSMRSLAEKVDYSPSALYKYFNSKEEIIETLRQEGWSQMEGLFRRRVDSSQTPTQTLVEAAFAYLELGDLFPELYQLMFNSTVDAPADVKDVENDPRFQVLLNMIRQSADSGEFTLPGDLSVLEYRYLAWFIMHGISMLKVSMFRNCREQFDPLAREIVRKFILFSSVSSESNPSKSN